MTVKPRGKGLELGRPVVLAAGVSGRGGYAMSRDGQRFLTLVAPAAANTDAPLTVVVNWPRLQAKK